MADSRPLNIALGFDGGGTKTDCVIIDADGKICGRGTSGPSNPLRIGFEQAFKELGAAAAQALDVARLKPSQIDAVCAGLAGTSGRGVIRRAIVFLTREFPNALTHVTADSEVALEAAVGPGAGVVLVAGTGSAAFGRTAAGLTARAGGYGREIGDEGSAYDIGRRAVACVARVRDQGAASTLLCETLPAALGTPSWDVLLEHIAKNPDDVFPPLLPVVFAAAEMGDPMASEILSSAALSLADMAVTVICRLEMQHLEFQLAKCGGVFAASSLIDTVFDRVVLNEAPQAKIARLDASPALGAAALAARLARTAPTIV